MAPTGERHEMKAPQILTTLVLTAVVCSPAVASAAGNAQLHAGFEPDRLGVSTTITIAFRIGTANTASGSPLTNVEMRLPVGVTAGFNTLGVATCSPTVLEARGPGGCSPDALVGHGGAVVAVELGSERLSEPVDMSIFMAPAREEHTAMLFYASGTTPVISELVFPGLLLGDSGPFGARLDTTIPPVSGLPGGPEVALISMRAEMGGKGLTYYKRVHGVTVPYSPEGFAVPSRCPHGGFPFAAVFSFQDGATESAKTTVPCPRTTTGGRDQQSGESHS
jgi:hypothetical protein